MVKTMTYELIEVGYSGDFATITMNYPQRRNALSLKHMLELTAAFREVGESEARGVILAANGPAFSSGHDFGDMIGQDLMTMRELLQTCTTLMETIQSIPQPVLARVHAIATAAGCQLVATCDLAVDYRRSDGSRLGIDQSRSPPRTAGRGVTTPARSGNTRQFPFKSYWQAGIVCPIGTPTIAGVCLRD